MYVAKFSLVDTCNDAEESGDSRNLSAVEISCLKHQFIYGFTNGTTSMQKFYKIGASEPCMTSNSNEELVTSSNYF